MKRLFPLIILALLYIAVFLVFPLSFISSSSAAFGLALMLTFLMPLFSIITSLLYTYLNGKRWFVLVSLYGFIFTLLVDILYFKNVNWQGVLPPLLYIPASFLACLLGIYLHNQKSAINNPK